MSSTSNPQLARAGQLLRRVWQRARDNRLLGQAAELAFYLVLSLFPLLLLVVSLLGLLLHSHSLPKEALERYVATIAPDSASALIEKTLNEVGAGFNPFALSFAVVFLWWSSDKVMLAAINSLNVAYDVDETRPWWKKLLLSSALTVALLVLLAAMILILIYGQRWFAGLWLEALWLLVVGFMLVSFNAVYFFAPNITHESWRRLLPGTAVGTILWLLASLGLQTYLRHFGHYALAYGSIDAVIVLLMWLYLSSIAFVVGAEVNSGLDTPTGDSPQERSPA